MARKMADEAHRPWIKKLPFQTALATMNTEIFYYATFIISAASSKSPLLAFPAAKVTTWVRGV